MNSRAIATKILTDVAIKHRSLDDACLMRLVSVTQQKDISLIKAMCFGVLRNYFYLEAIVNQLFHKPPKEKDSDIKLLVMLGVYQLIDMNMPDYAAISETVNATRAIKKPWAAGLTNKLLRRFIKEKDIILANTNNKHSSPTWLNERLKLAWPKDWQQIIKANNIHPPMVLRVNTLLISRDDYLEMLLNKNIEASPLLSTAILLKHPLPVIQLPGFDKGLCSVQDAAGQLVANLLNLKPGLRVLDACAAPGSKTCHLLETEPNLEKCVAIDVDKSRASKINENVRRLQINHNNLQVISTDVTNIKSWWDNKSFDRILLDAPCSATGVIRRHPDIKLLRRPTDIATLAKQQLRLLTTLWPLVSSNGFLLYTTCSVLPEENQNIIKEFLNNQPDAKIETLKIKDAIDTGFGHQVLPGLMDGFFYAKIVPTQK